MTRLEYDLLVERLEGRYLNRGQALTRSAVAWAALGYCVLVVGLAGSFGLAAGCAWAIYQAPNAITIKLGFVLGLSGLVIGYSILRCAWVRLSPPEGDALHRHEVPQLFEMIDTTADKAGGIHFNRVLITDDLNAYVVQVPLLGIFGWYRNYLCLGLPLLDALSPEEFHAVLAHEFAHLSRSHGRTGNWLYRIRRSWENVATSLAEQGGMLVRPFHAFFDWFWPRFNARAFVLSRANEYEADAFSAATTSPATAARALQRIAVESHRLQEDFWGNLDIRSAREKEPPAAVFHEISSILRTRVEPANCLRWLNQQLAMNTDTSDTHPALRDRMSALGITPKPAPLEPILESAADALLGRSFAAATRDRLSRRWLDVHGTSWVENHVQCQKHREKLKELEASPPTRDSLWEMLRLHCVLDGIPAMRGDLETWISTHPDHGIARYLLGSHLLSINDPAGIAHLEHAAEASPGNTLECLGEMAGFHDRNGNADAIRELKQRADQYDSRMQSAMVERNRILPNDVFEPHGLSPEEIASNLEILKRHSEIREAWLVKKQTREFSRWPHFVLVVRLKFPALKFASDTAVSTILQTVADNTPMDAYVLVVNDEGGNKAAAKIIKAKAGSAIYQRES